MNTHLHSPRSTQPSDAPSQPSKFGAIIIGIVSLMAVIVPLLCGSSLLTNVGKVLAFESLGAVLISCMIMTIRVEGLIQRIKETVLAGPNRLVLAVVLSAIVSFLIGPVNKWLTVHELVRVIVCAAVYFAVTYNLRGRLTLLIDVILAVSAAVAIFGLASVGDRDFYESGGITGSFGTHEALGSFLMLVLPITASIAIFNRKDEKRRIASLAVSLLVIVCLAFSQSRSGWISELVALAVLAGLSARFYKSKTTDSKQKVISVLPFIAFAGVTGLLVLISGSGDNVQHRLGTLTATSTDMSLQERFGLWRAALMMLAAKPVLGWGLGSFPYIASRFTSVALPSSLVTTTGANLNNIAHNYYLQTAAETGIVGLGLYVAMLVSFFSAGIRAMGSLKDGSRKIVLAGVIAAMAGQVVDALTSPSYNIASISLFQWILMGIGMFAAGIPGHAEEPIQEPVPDTVSLQGKVRRVAAGAVAAVVCLSSMAVFVGSAGTAVADSYTHNGLTDTDDFLIGTGVVGTGYWVGQTFVHIPHHGASNHGSANNGNGQGSGNGNNGEGSGHNGQGNGNGNNGQENGNNGQGNGNSPKPTDYQDNGQINDQINDRVNDQAQTQ